MKTWTKGDKIAAFGVLVAIIAIIAAISLPEIRCKIGLEQCPSSKLYTGSVLDKEKGVPIGGAEVKLFTQGAPITIYTDSEGIYQFTVDPKIIALTGKIRVETSEYEIYDRVVDVSDKQIEDIRLVKISKPKQLPSEQPPTPSSEQTPKESSTSKNNRLLAEVRGKGKRNVKITFPSYPLTFTSHLTKVYRIYARVLIYPLTVSIQKILDNLV